MVPWWWWTEQLNVHEDLMESLKKEKQLEYWNRTWLRLMDAGEIVIYSMKTTVVANNLLDIKHAK